jgi:hypothetical protein
MVQFIKIENEDRIKFYSKLISNIEVGGGRTPLSSQYAYNLINPQHKLRESLKRTESTGLTRLEWTIYIPEEEQRNAEFIG